MLSGKRFTFSNLDCLLEELATLKEVYLVALELKRQLDDDYYSKIASKEPWTDEVIRPEYNTLQHSTYGKLITLKPPPYTAYKSQVASTMFNLGYILENIKEFKKAVEVIEEMWEQLGPFAYTKEDGYRYIKLDTWNRVRKLFENKPA